MNEKINEITTNILTILLVLMPLEIWPNKPDYYNSLRYVTLLVCGEILFVTFILKVKNIKFELQDKFVIIFGLLAIISTLFSTNLDQSIIGATNRYEGIFTILIYILIYFHAKNSFKQFKSFKNILLITYMLICIISYIQYYMPSTVKILPIFGKGAHGTIGNTNFTGSFISIILPALIFFYITNGKKGYAVFSTMSFITMIICIARSSWVAFGCYILIILIYLTLKKDKNYWKRFLILNIIFIISFCFVIFTKKNNDVIYKLTRIGKDVETIKEEGITNNIGSSRIEIWKMTVKVVLKNPIIGCGVDALNTGLEKYAPKENAEYIFNHNQYVDKAHNEYLQIAATMGIPALLVYLAFISSILLPNIKNVFKDDKKFVLSLVIVSYLIQAFFNISVIGVAPIFWFVLGIASKNKFPQA